jgi:hypothetical protein
LASNNGPDAKPDTDHPGACARHCPLLIPKATAVRPWGPGSSAACMAPYYYPSESSQKTKFGANIEYSRFGRDRISKAEWNAFRLNFVIRCSAFCNRNSSWLSAVPCQDFSRSVFVLFANVEVQTEPDVFYARN